MTCWEIIRAFNRCAEGWNAEAELLEAGVSLEAAQLATERFYSLTIPERLKVAGLDCEYHS